MSNYYSNIHSIYKEQKNHIFAIGTIYKFSMYLMEPKHFSYLCAAVVGRVGLDLVWLSFNQVTWFPKLESASSMNTYPTCIHWYHLGSTFSANHSISNICIIRVQLGYCPQGFLCIFTLQFPIPVDNQQVYEVFYYRALQSSQVNTDVCLHPSLDPW